MTIRIGQIDYANCTPIFTALREHCDCSGYRFVPGVPAYLNRLLAAGDIDVCPSSSIEYGLHPDQYFILPDLSISAVGAVKSVLLFSRLPLEELDRSTIGMTNESDTSVNLLRIILGTFCRFSNTFERTNLPFPLALESYPALLLIGDNALRASLAKPACYVYDLGELWQRFTGLPFVFALWLIRRDIVTLRRAEAARLAVDLVRSKRIAYESYDTIADHAAERSWMEQQQLIDYWRIISYDLTERHVEGLRTFFAHAAALGVLKEEPEIAVFGA